MTRPVLLAFAMFALGVLAATIVPMHQPAEAQDDAVAELQQDVDFLNQQLIYLSSVVVRTDVPFAFECTTGRVEGMFSYNINRVTNDISEASISWRPVPITGLLGTGIGSFNECHAPVP